MSGYKSFNRALVGFEVLFLLAVLAVGLGGVLPPLPGGVELLAVLALAAFRASRSVSFNQIGQPLREKAGIETRPDSSGAGDNCHATGGGLRRAVGELIVCPICSGQWAALAVLAVLAVPGFGAALVWTLAAGGAVEILHWVAEWFEWGGRYSRERAGLHNRQAQAEQVHQAAVWAQMEAERCEKERIVGLVRGNGNGRN